MLCYQTYLIFASFCVFLRTFALKMEEIKPKFNIGDFVYHDRFGVGEIKRLEEKKICYRF